MLKHATKYERALKNIKKMEQVRKDVIEDWADDECEYSIGDKITLPDKVRIIGGYRGMVTRINVTKGGSGGQEYFWIVGGCLIDKEDKPFYRRTFHFRVHMVDRRVEKTERNRLNRSRPAPT